MDERTFHAVDEFIAGTIAADDAALSGAIEVASAEDMPEISVTPPQGKLLTLLARSIGARTILEFGTLGGYSTIHLARALPADGRLVTLEAKAEFAEVARASIDRAGVGELVEIRVGPALIVADNVVRGGTLADPHDPDPATRAQRQLHETLANEPRVSATTIQTVGAKGHDGFTLALVGS